MNVFSDQSSNFDAPQELIKSQSRTVADRLSTARSFAFWACVVLVCLSVQMQAAAVRAYVQPEAARPNQVINYVITVQDGQVQSLPNLRFPLQIGQTSGVSTSQQVSIINGRQSVSLQLSWGIAATEPGDFVIPTQTIIVDGQPVTTNEVKLSVGQGDAPKVNGQAGEDKNAPILQIELSKKEIYQGEVMPVTCSLYVPRQTQLRRLGLIEIEKSDFAIARFPQTNEQSSTIIDGQSYYVLSFRSTLSSLRTGDLKVGPAKLEMLIEVPMEGQQSQILPPGFPQGFFGGVSEPRKLEVKSQQVTLRVLPLPTEGKPANFSGAVGDFQMTATATPNELTVGDPVSVEIAVSGAGNFDALNTPNLVSTGGWKLYPAKRYNIEGQIDQNQTPTLERRVGYSQVMVPEAVHNEVPPFELTYFSSTDKKYVTLRTAPIPMNMKPAPAAAEALIGAASTVVAEVAPLVSDPQANITDILIRTAGDSKWVTPTNSTLMQSKVFWSAQAVPIVLFALACGIAWLRRRQNLVHASRSGELLSAWKEIESSNLSDQDFLRRSAQFIQVLKPGVSELDADVKTIYERYALTNFTASHSNPLTATEKSSMLKTLNSLMQQSIKKLSLLLLAFCCSSMVQAQVTKAPESSNHEIYQSAVTELEKGNFTKAQYLAESLTKKTPPQLSAEVFQIIGHARYRQKDLGRAALWYQRAQLLDGRNPELRQNLRHLFDLTRFLSFNEGSPLTEISFMLSLSQWLYLVAVGIWLLFLPLAWRVLTGHSQAWPFALSAIGLVILLPASTFASLRPASETRVEDISLVNQPDVSAYTAATVTSGSVISLPPGSQVRVLEKRGSWVFVEIPNVPENLRGWVESGALTPLWIWDEKLVP